MKRRDFLRKSSVALGAASMGGSSQSWAGANDRLRVAMIGMGGRGRNVMLGLSELQGIEVATLCDPDENRLGDRAGQLEEHSGKKPKLETDMRRIMDDQSIDAVFITCCNHWHALAGIWACQSGKHVYVEKPVCHTMREGRMLVEASRHYDRVVMGGTQRRSHPNFRAAIKVIKNGLIGDIYMARWLLINTRESIGFKPPAPVPSWLDWNLWRGPAPEQPFHHNLVHYNWHWFWDFGGGEMGNNGSHRTDICHWAFGKEKGLPSRINAVGGRYGYNDQAQTPNTMTSTWEFADGTILQGEIRGYYSGEDSGWDLYGTKGHMKIFSGGRFEVFLGRNKKPEPGLGDLAQVEGGWKSVDKIQFRNFFEAIRADKPGMLNAEIEEIYLSNAICILSNISYRLGRELRFDPKTETFPDDEKANRLLTRNYHRNFVLPNKV